MAQERWVGGGFTPGEGTKQAVPSELVIIPVGPIPSFLNGTGALALPINYETDVQ